MKHYHAVHRVFFYEMIYLRLTASITTGGYKHTMYIYRMETEDLKVFSFPKDEYAEIFKKSLRSTRFKYHQLIIGRSKVLDEEIKDLPLYDGGDNNVVKKLNTGDYLILNPHDITPGFVDRSFVIYTMLHNNATIRIKKGNFKTEEQKTLAEERQAFFKKQADMCKEIAKLMQVPKKDTLDPTEAEKPANKAMQDKVDMWDNANDEPTRWILKKIYHLVKYYYENEILIKKLPKLKKVKENKKTTVQPTSRAAFMGEDFESEMESEDEEEFEEQFNTEFNQRQNLYM